MDYNYDRNITDFMPIPGGKHHVVRRPNAAKNYTAVELPQGFTGVELPAPSVNASTLPQGFSGCRYKNTDYSAIGDPEDDYVIEYKYVGGICEFIINPCRPTFTRCGSYNPLAMITLGDTCYMLSTTWESSFVAEYKWTGYALFIYGGNDPLQLYIGMGTDELDLYNVTINEDKYLVSLTSKYTRPSSPTCDDGRQ